MNIAIVGSRGFTEYSLLSSTILSFLKEQNILDKPTIISGGAKGADTLAEQFADENGFSKQIFKADWEKVRCRGWMRDEPNIDTNGEWCEFFAETAWCEPPEWRHFLESKIPDLKILYLAIETGLDVFATNDDAYDGKYYVDSYPNFPDDPIMTEEEICAFIKKNYQIEVNNIEECNAVVKEINDKNEDGDEFIYINAIESYDD